MNVQMLTLAGIFAVFAVIPWIHIGKGAGRDDGWFPRGTAWLFAMSAATFTLAVTSWRDALAAVTGGAGGVGLLTVVVAGSGLFFFFQAVHRRKDQAKTGRLGFLRRKNAAQKTPEVRPHQMRHHYNRLWTMVVSGVFGTALVLAWVRGKQIMNELVKSPGRTAAALGQYSQEVHDGAATKGMTTAQVHHILLIGGFVVVAIFLAFRGYERKRHGKPEIGRASCRERVSSPV